MLEDKARFDLQSSLANLEKVLCKKKQEEQLFNLEKEMLILKTQALKRRFIDANE